MKRDHGSFEAMKGMGAAELQAVCGWWRDAGSTGSMKGSATPTQNKEAPAKHLSKETVHAICISESALCLRRMV